MSNVPNGKGEENGVVTDSRRDGKRQGRKEKSLSDRRKRSKRNEEIRKTGRKTNQTV